MKFNEKETESKARQEAALQALHDENKRLGLYDYEIGFIEGKAHYKTSRQELREQIEGLERDYELLLAEKKRTWVGHPLPERDPVLEEREACAKIADEWAVGWPHPSQVIAERIRERGKT
jgi:hypothetical protein